MKKILFGLIVLIGIFFVYRSNIVQTRLSNTPNKKTQLKLYWFIPDGVRNDPNLFSMYTWAKEGKLPNIKKMMDNGSFGYSYPNFPSHTPTNFATLLTGAYPSVNGVNDGPMHVIGKPLDSIAIGGFRSVAKKVAPIWKTLEEAGMKVSILSVPGSTPPEITKGVVVHGRWGGWGADYYGLNFETKGDLTQRIKQGRASRWFYFGPEMTNYIDGQVSTGWENAPVSYSEAKEMSLTGWGSTIYGYITDTTDDKKENYDAISFSLDKKTIFSTVKQGQWSEWQPITLSWKVQDQVTPVDSHVRLAAIKIGDDGFFRVRVLYDNLNKYIAIPETIAEVLEKEAGPMVDFADNFPAQLVYYPEDKQIFLDEAGMSFDWHTKAIPVISEFNNPDVVIHDIYTPNQMLTSKWWMGYADPKSVHYKEISDKDRESVWKDIGDMYKKLDDMVGEIMKQSGKDTYIVFSSDHGAVPLNRFVNLNNIFASKGWLKFTINPKTGEPIIDWKKSSVIYLKMAHVYINPNGLAGNYTRASGPQYEALRNEVISTLTNLTDEQGVKPVVDIQKWEDVKQYLNLDPDRAGDLVIANAAGYGWNEEMSADLSMFTEPLISGYKQAIYAKDEPGMWTPFIIMGPGIKKNNFMGDTPFPLVDQYPTIMNALKKTIPSFVQGKSLPIFTDSH